MNLRLSPCHHSSRPLELDGPSTILMVADDPILLDHAALHLTSLETRIATAPDDETAWSMLTAGEYDIAVLDSHPAALDGFRLLQIIRADARLKELPVVMLTEQQDREAIDRAYRSGADAFAVKPVNWMLLGYELQFVLKGHRTKRAPTPADCRVTPVGDRQSLRVPTPVLEAYCDVF
jgi:DNA-binding response OmpR family regulator